MNKPTVGPLSLKVNKNLFKKYLVDVILNLFLNFPYYFGGRKFLFGLPGGWARGEEALSAPRQLPQPSGSWAEGYGPPQS